MGKIKRDKKEALNHGKSFNSTNTLLIVPPEDELGLSAQEKIKSPWFCSHRTTLNRAYEKTKPALSTEDFSRESPRTLAQLLVP